MWKKVAVSWNNKTLNGKTCGSGPKLILALHGFSNDSSIFYFLSPLQEQYTILAVDLPFHGNSNWQRGDVLTEADVKSFIAEVCSMFGVEKLLLCGFSMGGRIALKIAELMPEKIERLVLIAPDGLVFRQFYYFVTRTAIGRAMFKQALTRPDKLKGLLNFAKEKKWLSGRFYEFLQRNLENDYYRRLIVDTWLSTSQLIPSPAKVKKLLQRYHIETHLLMGKNDNVIPLSHGVSFAANADCVHLHVLDKGHWLFDGESVGKILNSFL